VSIEHTSRKNKDGCFEITQMGTSRALGVPAEGWDWPSQGVVVCPLVTPHVPHP